MTLPPPPSAQIGPLRTALAPHWGALLALALFLGVGLAVLDDYGVAWDEIGDALRAARVWAFLAGNEEAFFDAPFYVRIYGPSFELALLFAERSLGIEGGRGVHLAQHLLLHLSFLAGGLFVYLLARRLSGNSLVSLFAMAIFLLHPRLYAHSFFNSKDFAFLVAFIIALYLAHRAFRRQTIPVFVLLGVGVGIAVNFRIMGIVLLAAIPALRTLDLLLAQGWPERKRVILTTGAFALAAALSVYALMPYLWADPLARAVEWWTTLSAHPEIVLALFRGTLHVSNELPSDYVPTWFLITSPPFALALGFIGAGAVLVGAVRAPRAAIRSGSLRFGLLLVGCAAAPVAAVVTLNATTYHDWRHLYFLWAPFALLASVGLAALIRALGRPRLRAAVYGAAGAGLAATLASMALIHPNQQVYFNFSADRVTPEYLRTQYVMEYWRHPMRQAFEWLSDNERPDEAAATGGAYWDLNARILPDAAKARLAETTGFTRVWPWPGSSWSRSDRAAHRVKVYDNTILAIERKDDPQAVYAAARGREPDDVAGVYDVHRLDDAVALVMEPCAPSFIENVGSATLRVTPVDPADLPPWREGEREEPRGFPFLDYGAYFDGKCVASLPLPDYPIADFRLVWRPELLDREAARGAARHAKEEGQLLARSAYDVYLANGELLYVQEACDPLDTEQPFRVSVFPQRTGDLPEEWRGRGHERFWFDFHEQGALLEDGACVALFPLPDYPIAAIRTAQYMEGGDDLWEAAFSANPEPYAATYRAVAGSEPLARAAFDLHLLDGDLVYAKEPCAQADTEARFFLHVIPERVGDLPEARQELGFDNLDFRFFLNGAWFDGKCATRVPLPPYPIARVRTGQFVGGVGEIWSAEFAVGR